MNGVRVDKWLRAARFFKTRSLATAAIDAGHVRVNGERVKPARDLRTGDSVRVHNAGGEFAVTVLVLSEHRGSATIAQTLYAETDASRDARIALNLAHRPVADPAEQIVARPTKKDRRALDRFRGG